MEMVVSVRWPQVTITPASLSLVSAVANTTGGLKARLECQGVPVYLLETPFNVSWVHLASGSLALVVECQFDRWSDDTILQAVFCNDGSLGDNELSCRPRWLVVFLALRCSGNNRWGLLPDTLSNSEIGRVSTHTLIRMNPMLLSAYQMCLVFVDKINVSNNLCNFSIL